MDWHVHRVSSTPFRHLQGLQRARHARWVGCHSVVQNRAGFGFRSRYSQLQQFVQASSGVDEHVVASLVANISVLGYGKQ